MNRQFTEKEPQVSLHHLERSSGSSLRDHCPSADWTNTLLLVKWRKHTHLWEVGGQNSVTFMRYQTEAIMTTDASIF